MLQQPTPIIVRVTQEPVESTTVADVLLGAIGLTGLLVIIAVVLGGLLGGILIKMKHLRARRRADGSDSDIIHIFLTGSAGSALKRGQLPECGLPRPNPHRADP